MVDTYTTGKLGLIEPARGGYVDTWDEPLFANWQTLEACISGTTTLTLSNTNIVLTVPTYPTSTNPPSVSTSCQNLRLYLTGALLTNLTVFIPATVGGFWILDDATTGNYTVTVKTTAVGSTGVTSIQGKRIIIYSDGTDVKTADNGIVDPLFLVPTGSIISYAGTVPPTAWLFCDGSAVSRTTYADLFGKIGTTWGNGDGLTTFNIPDLQNMFLRGSGSQSVAFYEADTFASHSHGVNDPGHSHFLPYAPNQHSGTGYAQDTPKNTATSFTAAAATGISIQSTGSAETRPVNKRVLYIIKT